MEEDRVENVEAMWARSVEIVREQVSEAVWNVYISHIVPVDIQGDSLTLAVPNGVIRERIVERFIPLLTESVAAETDEEYQIHVIVDDSVAQLVDEEVVAPQPAPTSAPKPTPRASNATQGSAVKLDPRFTFDTFVRAGSNNIAVAVAQSVAETPGRQLNPFYLYGASGLGKTHLLHAIGNYVVENYRTHKVLYVTTETFLNDYVDSIRQSKTMTFKRHYRECDVLLIDDIQFMENKEGLQEELFHTYNDLQSKGKQIVFTSDQHPKSLEDLEERLVSRLLSGMVVQIDPPDLETRLAILKTKCEYEHKVVPDEVLYFIAANVQSNVRELEGALTRVTAFSQLDQSPISMELAQHILADVTGGNQPRVVTPERIIEVVAEAYGFATEDLVGQRRVRPLVTARHVAMYLTRTLTEYSYPAIGRIFGGRDHTTCINAYDKIAGQMSERRPIYDQVTKLEQELRRSA